MFNSPNVKKTIVVYVKSRTRQQPRERWGNPNSMLGKGAKSNANKMMRRWKFRSAGASWLLQQLVCPWAPSMWLHAGRQVAGFREEAPPGCRTSRAPAAQADKALTRNIKEQSAPGYNPHLSKECFGADRKQTEEGETIKQVSSRGWPGTPLNPGYSTWCYLVCDGRKDLPDMLEMSLHTVSRQLPRKPWTEGKVGLWDNNNRAWKENPVRKM